MPIRALVSTMKRDAVLVRAGVAFIIGELLLMGNGTVGMMMIVISVWQDTRENR